MKIFTTLYILKYDPNPYNSIFKIGITGKTAQARCDEIRRTLSNGRIEVRWQGKFIGAYFIEQSLHVLFAPFNVRMPETVSGHTEFFDLNWVSVWVLIKCLELFQFVLYIVSLVVLYSLLKHFGVMNG